MPPKDKEYRKPFIPYDSGNPPKPILTGLTEEIISTGNLKQLKSFYKKNRRKMTKDEKEYMEARIVSAEEFERLHNKAVSDILEGKTAPVPEVDNKDGFIGFSNLKGDGIQTCGNGCWSYSYSILMKSRGVNISQEKIRAWRPDYSKDDASPKDKADQAYKKAGTSYRMNTDKGNSVFDNADIVADLLPNTSMTQISLSPFSPTSVSVDDRVPTAKEMKIIKDYHTEKVTEKLEETIKHAINVDHSPLSITWNGHYVTITGISEDGQTIRYEDSQQALAKDRTKTISLKNLVNLGMNVHYKDGRMYNPTGFNISWLHDLKVPEYEKREEEKPVLHEKEDNLVKVDETGKVKVDVPMTHPNSSAFGNGGSGMIKGKGINEQQILDMKELSERLGGKKVTSFGPEGGYVYAERDDYYPKRIYYLKDPNLENERLLNQDAVKNVKELHEHFAGVLITAGRDQLKGAWIDELRMMTDALAKISDYQNEPEDEANIAALPEAIKTFKTLPAFLTKNVGQTTMYKQIEEVTLIPYRPGLVETIRAIDDFFNFKIDFELAMGNKDIYPSDVEHEEYQKMRWNAMDQEDNNVGRKVREDSLAGILAAEEYRAKKIAEGDLHPEMREAEVNAVKSRIRESEFFKRMLADGGDIELSKLKDTKKLLEIREEAEKQVRLEERRKLVERDRQKYETYRKKVVDDYSIGFKPIIDILGPKGKLPENDIVFTIEDYNNVQVEVPEGLSEELVTAVIIGAIMDPDLMKKAGGEAVNDEARAKMNQRRLVSDVLNGAPVDDEYVHAMYRGKQKAQQAIEAYKNGKKRPLMAYLQNFADYAAANVSGMSVSNGGSDTFVDKEKMAFKFCQEVVVNGQFAIKPQEKSATEIETVRLAAYSKEMDAQKRAEAAKNNLISNFAGMSKAEKEALVSEMILDTFMASRSRVEEDRRAENATKNQEKAFRNIGIDELMPEWEETGLERGNELYAASIKAIDVQRKYAISDMEVIMSQPNGREQLKALYMEDIKKSTFYKNILKASTKAELIDGIKAMDFASRKGIEQISDVSFMGESAKLNAKYKDQFEAGMKSVRDDVIEVSFDGALVDETKYNGIKSLNQDEIKKNSRLLKALRKKMKDNNTWGGSKNHNYRNMMDKLEELSVYMAELAKSKTGIGEEDVRKYEAMAREVDSLGEKYLLNKTDINSTYAENRVACVKEVRRAIRATLPTIDKAIENMKKMKAEEFYGEKTKTAESLEAIVNGKSPYYGNKYESVANRRIPGGKEGYSLGRWAGISTTVLAMAASGKYTVEEIVDPSKRQAEKAEMFDKIATAMKNQSPEDNKFLASVFHEGRNAMNKLMNDLARKIDFTSPTVMQSKDFCMLQKLNYYTADAEQEMKHCKDDLLPLLQKDDPSIKKWDDVEVLWSPLHALGEELENQQNAAIKLSTEKDNLGKHAAELIGHTIVINTVLKDLAKAQKEHPDKDFKDWFTFKEKSEYMMLESGLLVDSLGSKLKYLNDDPKMARNLTEEILNGKTLDGIKLNIDVAENKVTAENFPSKEELKTAAENGRFLEESREALRRLGSYKYTDRNEFLKDSAYALFGQVYRLSGGSLPIDRKTGKAVSLEQYAKSQIKNPAFREVIKSETNPGKLMKPREVAELAKDDQRLIVLVTANNAKYLESQKQKDLGTNKKVETTKKVESNPQAGTAKKVETTKKTEIKIKH